MGEARTAMAGKSYVIKGGSFLCAPNYCMRYRSGAREPQEADLAASHLGFRTVLRAPGPQTAKPERP
jgi:formylglycine-generating enzyme required for sulfatase activity